MGTQLILRDKMSRMQMSKGRNVEEYIREIDNLVMQLVDINFVMEDKQLIRTTLKGLRESWKPFIMSFGTLLHHFLTLSLSDLIGHLEAECHLLIKW